MTPKAGVRAKADRVTGAVIDAIATYVVLSCIPLLPRIQLVYIIFAALVGLAAYKSLATASKIVALIFLGSTFYHCLGLGVLQLLMKGSLGLMVLFIILVVPVFTLLSRGENPVSSALAITSVALLLTPYYYLSVVTIIAAAAIGKTANMSSIASSFIFSSIPFIALNNALYFLQDPSAQAPILFTQLSYLAEGFRPPLSSLNFFVTGFPSGFFYDKAGLLSDILLTKILTLIVPWFMLSVTFTISSEVAGVVSASRRWIENAVGERVPALEYMLPLISSLLTPIVFIAFITFFSIPQLGYYQVEVGTVSLHMILASAALGLVFAGREYAIAKMEEVERLRAELSTLLSKATEKLGAAEDALNVGKETFIGFAEIEGELEKHASLIQFVRKGMDTAGKELLTTWVKALSDAVGELEKVPEKVRATIVSEANTLRALVETYNSYLSEVKLDFRLTDISPPGDTLSLKELSDYYVRLVGSVERDVREGYSMYLKEFEAYSSVFERGVEVKPTDPSPMLSSHEYASAMKIVFEDYIYSFFESVSGQLNKVAENLREMLRELEGLAPASTSAEVRELAALLASVKPSVIEKVLSGTLEAVEATVSSAKSEAEEVVGMVGGFEVSKLVRIESASYVMKLNSLLEKVRDSKPTANQVQEILGETLALLKDFNEAKKADENSLIIISSYIAAERVIEDMLSSNGRIEVKDLPFERGAAKVFASMYALNRKAVYDEEKEVILSEM
jgi:hypothetical protein